MRRKIYWSLGVGLAGIFLAQKGTYYFSGTFLRDLETLTVGALGGVGAGFLLGCIVERTTGERNRRLKVLYWVLVMAILGSYLGVGRQVPIRTTSMVMMGALGTGLLVGFLQYFLQSGKPTGQSSAKRLAEP